MRLGETLTLGGPSLMIRTLEKLTDVRIEHYSKMDYPGLPRLSAQWAACTWMFLTR